jgi:predicted nucleic-acid-binding Zn-ribbon protein
MSYKGSVSRIEKWSRFVLFLVMLILAGFLSALGNKILSDVNHWVKAPQEETYQDKEALQKTAAGEAGFNKQIESLEDTKGRYQTSLEKAERQYESQKQSYGDWLQARSTIGSSQEDSEVRLRAKTLDRFRQIQESWQVKIDEVNAQINALQEQRKPIREKLRNLEQAAGQKYNTAMEHYGLKIFFIRLAFVLPMLLIGVFLFLRGRNSRFWPLVWGMILFSLYCFFVGLLPYLPSFGGYIRLVIGAALSLFIGYYVVKQLNRYLAKKKAELEESTKERVSKIKDDIAHKAYLSHSCPSCERDFLINKWYPKVGVAGEIRTLDEAPDHCAFCGLPLFGKCPKCGKRNFLHFPFCSACGTELANTGK